MAAIITSGIRRVNVQGGGKSPTQVKVWGVNVLRG